MHTFHHEIVTNIAAYMAYLISWFVFYRIVQEYQQELGERPTWETLALVAAHPVVLVAGGTRGDYIYSLLLVELGWLSSLRTSPGFAGVFAGLASGFRISSCIWGLPFLLIFQRRGGWVRSVEFVFTAMATGYLVWHPYILHYHTLNPLALLTGARDLAGTNPSLLIQLKSSTSKILAVIGLPIILFTAVFAKQIRWKDWLDGLFKAKELMVALTIIFAVFTFLPAELGYVITIVPVFALLYPKFEKNHLNIARAALVFMLNFAVLGFQNQVWSKIHFSQGYYISEFTCGSCTTALESVRFSIPRDNAGNIIYPPGDWASRTYDCPEKR